MCFAPMSPQVASWTIPRTVLVSSPGWGAGWMWPLGRQLMITVVGLVFCLKSFLRHFLCDVTDRSEPLEVCDLVQSYHKNQYIDH